MPLRVEPAKPLTEREKEIIAKHQAEEQKAQNPGMSTAEKAMTAVDVGGAAAGIATSVVLPPVAGAKVGLPNVIGGLKKVFTGQIASGVGQTLSGAATSVVGFFGGGAIAEGASTVIDGVGAVTHLPTGESNAGAIIRGGNKLAHGGAQAKASDLSPPASPPHASPNETKGAAPQAGATSSPTEARRGSHQSLKVDAAHTMEPPASKPEPKHQMEPPKLKAPGMSMGL